jgi:DNA (cytosine-5)-methyltransferase 1
MHKDCRNRMPPKALRMSPSQSSRVVDLFSTSSGLTSVELCAGGGGQALGLEQAGFNHVALVEIDKHSCETLKRNRTHWNVVKDDLRRFEGRDYKGVDLLAGGLPCPPFSVAGKQLGEDDERNLFPATLGLVRQIRPRAILIENVPGLLDTRFANFRRSFTEELDGLGYVTFWHLLNACDFGVPQLRPRVVIVALLKPLAESFSWPQPTCQQPLTVGETLFKLMSARGWRGAKRWKMTASAIAPTIVGGSLKHGGPDLGPTRARKAWATLGVDGLGIADEPPAYDFVGIPKLTVRMVARLQGFDEDWDFAGGKTAAYRQVGNAFPPPVAQAVGIQLRQCLTAQLTTSARAGPQNSLDHPKTSRHHLGYRP